MSRQVVRDRRGARGDRRNVGPVPLPGHSIRFGLLHALLPVPSLVRSTRDRGWRLDPRLHPRHGARAWHRQANPLPPSRRGRRVVFLGYLLAGGDRAQRHRRDDRAQLRLPVHLHGLLPLRRGLHARASRHRALRRRGGSSAVLERRGQLRRPARGGDRQRRDRGHADSPAGTARSARDDAAALAQLHHLAARRRSRGQGAQRRATDPLRLSARALEERHPRAGDLGSEPSPPRHDEAADPPAAQAPAPTRLRHRHAFQPELRAVGSAHVHRAGR